MQPVYDRVARDLDAVKRSVEPLKSSDAVTWWSAEQLRTWSNRPWHKDGKQLPLVHHASVDVEAKFKDFAALSRWVGEHTANTEGFRVGRVEWALTERRKEELTKDVRTKAVRDAVTRAQQYADALNLGTITPLAIADAGMLSANLSPATSPSGNYFRAQAVQGGGAPDVEFAPQHIEITAQVDARFEVTQA